MSVPRHVATGPRPDLWGITQSMSGSSVHPPHKSPGLAGSNPSSKGPVQASVLLLTYNQIRFVTDSLRSVLAQDLDEIQVVVSDDCSNDGTWERLCEEVAAYQGPKEVVLRRNTSNLGIVGNLLEAARCAVSPLLFLAHGDDISLPNRCSQCLRFRSSLEKLPELIAADAYDMSEDGLVGAVKKVDDLSLWSIDTWSNRRPFVLGAAQMITKDLLEVGPLDVGLLCEDQCICFRAIVRGTAVRLPEPLIKHRRGGLSQELVRGSWTKRQALLRSARAALVELEQLEQDATRSQCLPRVRAGLLAQRQLNTYIAEMLGCQLSLYSRIQCCWRTALPLSKRIRFLFWSFRGLRPARIARHVHA